MRLFTERVASLAVDCPNCLEPAGEPCRDGNQEVTPVHDWRLDIYKRLVACGAAGYDEAEVTP